MTGNGNNSGHLPAPLSTFIGREHEIKEVSQLFTAHRLITLTGPGGCGKTRLAIKVAHALKDRFDGNIWMTELAPLTEASLVAQAVASTLGIREQPRQSWPEGLKNFLHSRRTILVLDNCEHLIEACAELAELLLQACPGLTILATSREPLRIAGELVWTVPPMSLPSPQPWKNPRMAQSILQNYQHSEAFQLFTARARSVLPHFTLDLESGGQVAEICRRLDGMPLAIELAAARVRTLSIEQIAERLDNRFHLLTGGNRTAPPRQQTLAATIDWSYALLSEVEQRVLQRLSVFAGGATLEAAESVCGAAGVEGSQILDVLSRLVEKSLLVSDSRVSGETHYHLLETIRQYAREKLALAGEADETQTRHLNYFVQWAERAEPHLNGGEQIVTRHLNYLVRSAGSEAQQQLDENAQLLWLKRFEMEHDNLRAALDWSAKAASRAEAGLRLAAITAVFWKIMGPHGEGRMRLATALAQEGAQDPTLVRALALLRNSLLAFYQSDYPAVRALAQESLLISRTHGTAGKLAVADALEILAEAASETGDYSTATKFYEEALPLYKELGDLVGIGDTLKMLGWSAMRTGDYEQAEPLLNEGLLVCRQSGDLHQIVSALSGLGELSIRQGRYARAQRLLQESLTLNKHIGEKWGFAIALGNLGWVALLQHDFAEMRKLLGDSLNIRMETGDRGGTAWCLEKLAEASTLQSRLGQAVIIFGAAAALRAPVGSAMDAVDRPEYERLISKLRTSLGQDAFEAAWTEGQSMTVERVCQYALVEPELTEIEVSLKEKFGGLTAREREVAVLIAHGKSNREVAKAMTIGTKTVETYVTRILNKLGFDSRVQIATWMIEKGINEKESQ